MSRYALGSAADLVHEIANVVGVGMDPGWLAEFPARLARVTAAEVAEVARGVYGWDRFTGVLLGDIGRIGPLPAGAAAGPLSGARP
jgi:hypothetical protein